MIELTTVHPSPIVAPFMTIEFMIFEFGPTVTLSPIVVRLMLTLHLISLSCPIRHCLLFWFQKYFMLHVPSHVKKIFWNGPKYSLRRASCIFAAIIFSFLCNISGKSFHKVWWCVWVTFPREDSIIGKHEFVKTRNINCEFVVFDQMKINLG